MTGTAKASAVRPALERPWSGAGTTPRLHFTPEPVGVLGVPGRADTVEELSELLRSRGVEPLRWYGVWLFAGRLEFSGADLDPRQSPGDSQQVAATAAAELEASRRDPYRQLSRVFHLVGRKGPSWRDNSSHVLTSAPAFAPRRHRYAAHPRPILGVARQHPAMAGKRMLTAGPSPLAVLAGALLPRPASRQVFRAADRERPCGGRRPGTRRDLGPA